MDSPRSVNDFTSSAELHRALRQLINVAEDGTEEAAASNDQQGKCESDNNQHDDDDDDDDDQLDNKWDWVLENYDVGTTIPQSISQELHRLQVLKSYLILDQERDRDFDRLTTMASRVLQVPIALVSLIDLGRQWFMSSHGLEETGYSDTSTDPTQRQTSRKVAFCAHAIQGKSDILLVKDATKDPRFCDMLAVTGPPHVRFYAGTPLQSPEGYKLGTFCIVDTKPRPDGLSEDEQANLKDFAAMAMEALVTRRQALARENSAALVACTSHDLITPLMGLQLSLSLMHEDAERFSARHRELIDNALKSSDWLQRISQSSLETLREGQRRSSTGAMTPADNQNPDNNLSSQMTIINMNEFVSNLKHTLASIPKRVPLIISADDSVPERIVSDDLKLFRSSINLLKRSIDNTTVGSIQFHIYAQKASLSDSNEDQNEHFDNQYYLVFECKDTAKNTNAIDEASQNCLFKPCKSKRSSATSSSLGFHSIRYQIDSLGGSYGYRSRVKEEECNGSVSWFRVPIILPVRARSSKSTCASFILEAEKSCTEKRITQNTTTTNNNINNNNNNNNNNCEREGQNHNTISKPGVPESDSAASDMASSRPSSFVKIEEIDDIEDWREHMRKNGQADRSTLPTSSAAMCHPFADKQDRER